MHERARGHEVEHSHSHFFMSKNKKEAKQGREAQQSCTNVQVDTRLSAVTLIFYV